MNCKQGDLAVIVRSGHGHEGKIVRCLDMYVGYSTYYGKRLHSPSESIVWLLDATLHKGDQANNLANDCNLRPIRDQDGQDETLIYAGFPSEVYHA